MGIIWTLVAPPRIELVTHGFSVGTSVAKKAIRDYPSIWQGSFHAVLEFRSITEWVSCVACWNLTRPMIENIIFLETVPFESGSQRPASRTKLSYFFNYWRPAGSPAPSATPFSTILWSLSAAISDRRDNPHSWNIANTMDLRHIRVEPDCNECSPAFVWAFSCSWSFQGDCLLPRIGIPDVFYVPSWKSWTGRAKRQNDSPQGNRLSFWLWRIWNREFLWTD